MSQLKVAQLVKRRILQLEVETPKCMFSPPTPAMASVTSESITESISLWIDEYII